jgi:1,2-diacylglycerol 3-beta-glucosyltransferase
MGILLVLLGALVAVLWLPAVSELVALFRRRHPTLAEHSGSTAKLLFLVPAHDEQLLIAECVDSLVGMEYPRAMRRIVVIADNCADATAQLAREHGAEVLERHDKTLPGKPRAIRWALDQSDLEQWDACVIVDADSTVDPGFATALARFMPLRSCAVQAYFGARNEWDSWLTRLGGVLARGRYEVSYPLRQAAGLNCPLTGNGMCIGAGLLRDGGWQAFSLTEDWELYASYTTRGVPIRYARNALLFSEEARSMKEGGTQRRRWQAGRGWVLRHWWRPLLTSRRIGWHQKLDALAELAGPSPVIHLVLALTIAAVSWLVLGGSPGIWLALLALGSLAPLLITTGIVFIRHPQPFRTAVAFVMLPPYAVWRIVMALRTVLLPEEMWRKTERHRGTDRVG